jgi:hypothetical protein
MMSGKNYEILLPLLRDQNDKELQVSIGRGSYMPLRGM